MTEFDKLWNYNEPEATRGKFVKFLEDNQASLSLDEVLQLKTQIARTHSLKMEMETAHAILDEVEGALGENTPLAEVRYLLERGRACNSAGEKSKALVLFVKAVEMSAPLSDNLYIDAVHMATIADPDLDTKKKWSALGVERARNSADETVRGWEGIFLNNTGWDLFEAGRFEEALELFLACETFHADRKNERPRQIATWSIAKTLRLLGKHEQSMEMQQKLLAEKGGKDPSGYVYEELGELYLEVDQEASRKFLGLAHEILKQDPWLQKHEPKRLERLQQLS